MAADAQVAVLEEIVEHGGDTRSLFFRPAAPLDFRPGQFVSCLLPVDGQEIIRPYTIASSPGDERLELLLNLVPGGPGSRYLFGLRPGATLRFTGPWGTFVCDRAPAAEAVFVAADTAIAPIRPMLHRVLATAPTRPVRLLYAASHPVYRAELDHLQASTPLFSVDYTAPDTLEAAVRGRWVDADTDRTRQFFVCAVGPVVYLLRDLLRAAGYERRAVHYEKW